MPQEQIFGGFEIGRAIIQTLISLAVGIWFIIAYSDHENNKWQCAKPIATWLLVTGISQLVLMVVSLIATFACKIGVKSADKAKKHAGGGTIVMSVFLCLCLLFMFAWWIVGQAWTFSISDTQCATQTYLTAFWYLVATYILMGLGIIVGIIYSIVQCCCAKKSVSLSTQYDY